MRGYESETTPRTGEAYARNGERSLGEAQFLGSAGKKLS